MIPHLLLEEPLAQTSAKEPWVSDGISNRLRGLVRKAVDRRGEG